MSAQVQLGQVFAGYRIEAVAGRGGMGIVYRATDLARGHTVALKLIAPEVAADRAFRERFRRESKLLASLDHPNVITVYEAGETDGQPFISMRYVEGTELQSLIAAEGWLAPERAARIVAQAADGLDAAHANGLVHRDVKPANVLIEWRGGSEHAYLSDFGLAKEVNAASAITDDRQWVGTLDYVAPEQIEARHVDARSDVYALGCVLFQTLTRRVPYLGDSPAAKLQAHLTRPVPSARELRPELPVEIDRVLARAMAKDPAQRYLSAGDLGRAAIAAAGGEAITEPDRSVATGAAAPAASRRLSRGVAVALGGALLTVAAVGTLALLNVGEDSTRERVFAADKPRIEHIDLGRRAIPGNITASSGGAYVLDRKAGKVVKVNPNGVVEGRARVGRAPTGIILDPDGDRLWVASRDDATVTELDLGGKRVGRAFRVQPDPVFLGVPREDTLLVLSQGEQASVQQVDKRTHRLRGKPEEINDPLPLDLEVSNLPAPSSIAIPQSTGPRIAILSPGRPLKTYILKAEFESAPGDVEIDDATGVGWVALSGDNIAGKDLSRVLRIDMRTGKQIGGPIRAGRGPGHIAIDEGVVWVTAVGDETVTRIDQESGRAIGNPIEVGPIAGPVAASGGMAWVVGEKDLIRITLPPR